MREWYKSPRWKSVRLEALRRDRDRCRECGGLATEVHHIIARGENPDLFFELDNLMSVCAGCHIRIEQRRHPMYVRAREEWEQLCRELEERAHD